MGVERDGEGAVAACPESEARGAPRKEPGTSPPMAARPPLAGANGACR